MRMIECPHCPSERRSEARILKKGFYRRQEDGRRIQRFHCCFCRRSFSTATLLPTCGQHKRRINSLVLKMLLLKGAERAVARTLGLHRLTIKRKRRYWASLGEAYMAAIAPRDLHHAQFDEMMTKEHTKCKPVSVPLAVDAKTYAILALDVVSMPAQHPLTETALRKYGPRRDDRPEGIARVLERIGPMLRPGAILTTDSSLLYPAPVLRLLPHVSHMTVRSRRGCVIGQGELKRIGFDPLFPLNQTAAMIRDHIASFVRRTWCTAKRLDSIRDYLNIYAYHHNTVVVPRRHGMRLQGT